MKYGYWNIVHAYQLGYADVREITATDLPVGQSMRENILAQSRATQFKSNQGLRIVTSSWSPAQDIWISYRDNSGYDTLLPKAYTGKVLVHQSNIRRWDDASTTLIVGTLTPGQTFRNDVAQITIVAGSILGSNEISVTICRTVSASDPCDSGEIVPPPATTAPPTQPPPNPCLKVDCGSNGNCDSATGTCTCTNNFTGPFCRVPPNPCNGKNCGFYGSCVVSGTDGVCKCRDGYTGAACDQPPKPVDKCASVACQNGGTCNSATGLCGCVNGFTGKVCEVKPPTTIQWEVEVGIAYPGNVIMKLKGIDTETCKALCAEKSECVAAISFPNGNCNLKHAFGPKANGAGTVYRKVITAADTCNDQNASCGDWAAVGECEKNPTYMQQICAKSCQAQGYNVNCTVINSKSMADLAMEVESVDEKSLVNVPVVTRIQAKWGDLLSRSSNPQVVATGSSVSIFISGSDSDFVVVDSTNAVAVQAVAECDFLAAENAGATGSSGEGSYLVELTNIGQYTFSSTNVDECLAGKKFQITTTDATESVSFTASVNNPTGGASPGMDQLTIILSAAGGGVLLIVIVAVIVYKRRAGPLISRV